jgi:hypothetical protein
VILGTVTFVFMQVRERTPINAQQATAVVTAALDGSGTAVIRFHTGLVKPGPDDKPGDPNYRLLEKAGIVKLAKAPEGAFQITLTPEGERLLTSIPECKKSKDADGTTGYQVPLAQRHFLSIAGIEMNGVNTAVVAYNWKWSSNALGEVFDAGGPLVKGFNTWDRQMLINKYGADFYHAEASRSTMVLARNGHDWKIAQ